MPSSILNSFTVAIDGCVPFTPDGFTVRNGSIVSLDINIITMMSMLRIENISETDGISLFVIKVEASEGVPQVNCDWPLSPITNADIQFVRANPIMHITHPSEILSGQAGITLDANATAPLYVGNINPAPSIASYAWIQTAGPAVALKRGDYRNLYV